MALRCVVNLLSHNVGRRLTLDLLNLDPLKTKLEVEVSNHFLIMYVVI